MANTLLTTVNWALPYLDYLPITGGTNSEPAISIGNMIISTMLAPPLTWTFNRNENSTVSTVAGTQDYAISLSDFGFLEKVSLDDGKGNINEVKDILNNLPLTASTTGANSTGRGRPSAVAVVLNAPGTSIKIRFLPVPDIAYTINLTYQKAPVAMVNTSSGWSGIPDYYLDIYNNLFLSEALAYANEDGRGQVYRQRGIAAFTAKADGLTEMQKNSFIQQWLQNQREWAGYPLTVNQGKQARSI